MNASKLCTSLSTHLPTIPNTESPGEITIGLFTKATVEALLIAVDEAVPWTTPSQFARSKFNRECKSAVVRKLQLRRQIWKRRLDGPS